MNSQEHKTTLTDPSRMMISQQLDNLVLRPNLKPKTTSHSQNRPNRPPSGLNSPLRIEDLCHETLSAGHNSRPESGPDSFLQEMWHPLGKKESLEHNVIALDSQYLQHGTGTHAFS